MELKGTNHNYYCNDGNYFNSNSLQQFETWEEFYESWLNGNGTIDHDYNHCFRFDIKPMFDFENDTEYEDRFSLKLYMMLQRKGNFIPITIKEIKQEDMPQIESYLKECWSYLKEQWKELDK